MQIKQKEFHKQWTNKKETFRNLGECDGNSNRHLHPKLLLDPRWIVVTLSPKPILLKGLSAHTAESVLLYSYIEDIISEQKCNKNMNYIKSFQTITFHSFLLNQCVVYEQIAMPALSIVLK